MNWTRRRLFGDDILAGARAGNIAVATLFFWVCIDERHDEGEQ